MDTGRSGEWVDVDPTLETGSDGGISTAATVSEISVSSGGEGPFVTVSHPEGGTFGLVWPEPLPEPILDGTTATYESVLPDVDLRVNVGNEQIGYVLVVHTPEAAQSPELDRIELEVVSEGLDMVQDEQTGLLHAVDDAGTQFYSSAPALMWDSSENGSEQASGTDSTTDDPLAGLDAADPTFLDLFEGLDLDADAESLPEPPSSADEDAAGSPEPMPGRVEQMEVDLEGRTLAVVPDEQMLDDPDVEYPVYIDPTFTGSISAYAKLHQQRPNQTMLWRNGSLAVGLQLWQTGSTYGLWRSAVRFGISPLHDRYIRSAKVQVTQTHLAGCGAQYLRLWRVRSISGSNTTWNNVSPLEGGYLQSKLVQTSNSATCGGTNQLVTYDNGNVTNVVRKAVNSGNNQISFMFQSSNENPNNNGSHAWRTLSASSAKIVVDHRPKKSTNLKTDGSNCSTSGPGPWVSSTRPKLTAKAPEFSGGSGYLQFHLYTASSGSNFYNWYVSANSGQTVTATVPSGKLTAGNTYRWRVMAKDSKSSPGAWQDMSRCWFRVNSTPSAPTGPKTDGLGCGTLSSPTLITTRTPNLTAVPKDPDGGDVRLRLQFYTSSAENLQDWFVDARSGTRAGGRLNSGVVSSDGLYGWRAYTYDGFGHGSASTYCWVRIDTTAPEPPDIAQVTANPEPGQQVTFDLVGSSGVTGFRYAIQGQTVETVTASGGSAQVTVTPPAGSNDHVLQVWAVDAAGNESSRADAWFTTGTDESVEPETMWRFDGDGFDDSGNGNDAVSSGLTFTTGHDGRADTAIAVNENVPSCAYSSTLTGPYLDTTGSFTVAAWVRKGGDGSSQMIINQGGAVTGGFYLMYAENWDRWLFSLPETDESSPNWATVASDEPPATGQWQHLAGVYDAPAERIRLYIDGELQDSKQVPFPAIASEGRLTAGCRVTTENYAYHQAAGTDLDDAAVFQQVLTGGQIVDLMEGRDLPAAMQAWYPLRGDGADYSGRAAPLTGTAEDAQWVPDHLGRPASALQINGDTCLTVPAPVDTAGSFTASMWVRPEPGAENLHTRMLSFNTDTYFTAVLKHDPDHSAWTTLVARDVDSEASWDGVMLADSAVPGEWTHIAMSVDRGTSTLTFYVDGEAAGTHAITGEAMSAVELSIGCGTLGGGAFTGTISDVRVWRGAVTADQISGMPTDLLAYWELDETLEEPTRRRPRPDAQRRARLGREPLQRLLRLVRTRARRHRVRQHGVAGRDH
ncbi:hypothetical protein GCM10029992_35790 [Glycomyces albus]